MQVKRNINDITWDARDRTQKAENSKGQAIQKEINKLQRKK